MSWIWRYRKAVDASGTSTSTSTSTNTSTSTVRMLRSDAVTALMLLAPFFLALSSAASQRISDVIGLRGEGDYRFVTLKWEYPVASSTMTAFRVHYCELQAWGADRCRTKMIEDSSGVEGDGLLVRGTSGLRMYTVLITGLKMATNYSFEVTPTDLRRTRYITAQPSSSTDTETGNKIIVTTKGFSARASLCLPDASEVEVSTGPYFNGRIAVEKRNDDDKGRDVAGSDEPVKGCWVEGDGTSPAQSYTLRISHTLCGSTLNSTAVATFILVQENLPILTHSTRRFLVLCTFHPETLTVRAGLNLPSTSPGPGGLGAGAGPEREAEAGPGVGAVLLAELSTNQLQPHHHPLQQHHHSPSQGEAREARSVVSGVAVVAALVGVALLLWWFIPSKTLSRGSSGSMLSEDCGGGGGGGGGGGAYDNYENSLRDWSEEDASWRSPTADRTPQEEVNSSRIPGGACNTTLIESLSPSSTTTTVYTITRPLSSHTSSEA